MLKQALDVLKKAEADAELMVASAKRRSSESRKLAEENREAVIKRADEQAQAKASEIGAAYSRQAEGIMESASADARAQAAQIAKSAAENRAKALNRAVERIVRRNGHR